MEKTVLDCVIEALDGLSADNFKRFKVKLCETRKIKYGQIENETTVDVAQRIVSTFTKAGAAKMTADVLRAIGLKGDAETLETEDAEVSGAVGREVNPGEAGEKGGASGYLINGEGGASGYMINGEGGASGYMINSEGGASGYMINGKHFVDRNMTALINRVTLVPPILDQLYQSGFIQHEMYMDICDEKTSFKQMRMLMQKVIIPGNNRAKDELCGILEKEQKYLMEELKGK